MKNITRIMSVCVSIMVMSGTILAAEEEGFLGVSTRSTDSATRAQLGLDLAPGMGLTVSKVVPESPAAGIAEVEDVMTRFDSQLLVNPQQLGVLVRAKKPGESVRVELIRKGESRTFDIVLGARPATADSAQPFGMPDIRILGPTMQSFTLSDDSLVSGGIVDTDALASMITVKLNELKNDDIQKSLGQISNIIKNINIDVKGITASVAAGAAASGNGTVNISTMVSTSMVDEETGATVSFMQAGDNATLKITDKAGKTVFDGPVNTDEDKEKIPLEYRETFDKMAKINITPWGEGGVIHSIFSTNFCGGGSCIIDIQESEE